MTPTSVVPPPMSTTIDPIGSATGIPAPIAAAIGSSISRTSLAPALDAASRIARRSTLVEPEGTQITTSVLPPKRLRPPSALVMKCLIICSATSRSAITPLRKRADGADIGRRLAEHQLGILADRVDLRQAIAIFPARRPTAPG